MTEYVVGFAHSQGFVSLVRKNRPEWQAGKLNGVGGHVEKGESPRAAMEREFVEETGVDASLEWGKFLELHSGDAIIHFYQVRVSDLILWSTAGAHEDEEIEVRYAPSLVSHRPFELIPNLTWILPLALYNHDMYKTIYVEEI